MGRIVDRIQTLALAFGAPGGADAIALEGPRLAVGVAGNFVLGVLMTMGVGLYGPCMILVSLLGMNATAAFPIMMGSCAFLMPVASARFIRTRTYHTQAAIGLMLGGVPAVLIAAYLVVSMPIGALPSSICCFVSVVAHRPLWSS